MAEKPTLDALRRQAGLRATELVHRANLSPATWNRINRREPVSYESAARLIRVLNEDLGTNYTVQSIDVVISD